MLSEIQLTRHNGVIKEQTFDSLDALNEWHNTVNVRIINIMPMIGSRFIDDGKGFPEQMIVGDYPLMATIPTMEMYTEYRVFYED